MLLQAVQSTVVKFWLFAGCSLGSCIYFLTYHMWLRLYNVVFNTFLLLIVVIALEAEWMQYDFRCHCNKQQVNDNKLMTYSNDAFDSVAHKDCIDVDKLRDHLYFTNHYINLSQISFMVAYSITFHVLYMFMPLTLSPCLPQTTLITLIAAETRLHSYI